MRTIFFIALLSLLSQLVKAQDTIQRIDGSYQLVRIIEITPSMVRYVPIENPDGPIFSISKQAISKIVYEDGRREFFNVINESAGPTNLTPPEIPFHYNKVSFNTYDLVFGLLSISYERISNSGIFGIKVPLSLGLYNESLDYYSHYWNSRTFSTGLGINYYPFGQEQVSWHLGISVNGGRIKTYYYDDYFENYKNITVWDTGLNTGAYYRLWKNFEFSSQLGVRWRSGHEFYKRVWFPLELNVCLKF